MKVLLYGDSPASNTGLGIVARHAAQALVKAGHEVVCFGVNHWVPYVDPQEHPYPVYAAGINPEGDPFGRKELLRLARRLEPDVVLSCTDFQLTASWLPELREFYDGPVVDYAPVDAQLYDFDVRHLELVNRLATYTRFGRDQLARFGFEAEVIYLGCDTQAFHPPRDEEEKRELKARIFKAPEAFLVVVVARNQWRKDLARSMAAFREFRDAYGGRALLYLHSRIRDLGGDLRYQAIAAGLDLSRDVVFAPESYTEVVGVPLRALSEVYRAADLVLSTSLGEGWGLSTTEAFASGAPFVGPRHTSFIELVGEKEERGWLADIAGWQVCYGFDCRPRPVVDVRSTVQAMARVALGLEVEEKVARALSWARQHPWSKMRRELVELVEEAAADG